MSIQGVHILSGCLERRPALCLRLALLTLLLAVLTITGASTVTGQNATADLNLPEVVIKTRDETTFIEPWQMTMPKLGGITEGELEDPAIPTVAIDARAEQKVELLSPRVEPTPGCGSSSALTSSAASRWQHSARPLYDFALKRFNDYGDATRQAAQLRSAGRGGEAKRLDELASAAREESRLQFEKLVAEFPQDPWSMPAEFWLGELALLGQDYAAARRRFEKVGALSPAKTTTHLFADYANYNLGWIHFTQEKDFDAAARSFTVTADHFANEKLRPLALFWAAEAFRRAGDLEQAARRFQQFVEKHPGHPNLREALLLDGIVLHHLGRYDEAGRILAEFERRYPQSDHLARILFVHGDSELRREHYQAAERLLTRYLQGAGDGKFVPDTHYRLMLAAFKLGEVEKAEGHLKILRSEYRDHPLLRSALFYMGQYYYGAGRCEDAEPKFQVVLDQPREDAFRQKTLFYLGECRFGRGEYQKALESYQNINLDAPPFGVSALYVLFQMSSAWTKQGEYAKADNLLKQIPEIPGDPDLVRAQYLKGYVASQLGRDDETIDVFERILREEAPDKDIILPYVLDTLGLFSARGQQYDKAIGYYTRQVEMLSETPENEFFSKALLGTANALFNKRDYTRAEQHYQRVIKLKNHQPIKARALYRLGNLKYRTNLLEDAHRFFGESIRIDPQGQLADDAAYWNALAYMKENKFAAAAVELEGFLANPQFAASELRGQAMLKLGDCYYNQGDPQDKLKRNNYKHAFLQYQELLNELKSRAGEDGGLMPEALYGMILSWYQLGEYALFEARVSEFLQLFPHHPLGANILFQLGDYYQGQKKWQDAADIYLRILQNYPGTELADDAYLQAALAFKGKGRKESYRLALQNLEQLVQQYPESPFVELAYKNMGDILAALEQYRDALNQYQLLLKQFPQGTQSHNAVVEATKLCNRIGDLTCARKFTARLSKDYGRDPATISAMMNLASLYTRDKKYDEAIKAYGKVLDTRSATHAPRAQFLLSLAYRNKGEKRRALVEFQKIPYLFPKNEKYIVRSLEQAGMIALDLGDYKQARRIFTKLLRHKLTPEKKTEIEELLAKARRGN